MNAQQPLTTQFQCISPKIKNLLRYGLWGRNYQGSFDPFEPLTNSPLNATIQCTSLLLSGNLKTWKSLNLTLNSKYQACLKPFNGTNFYVRMHNKFLPSSLFFTLGLVHTFSPPKDTPWTPTLSTTYNIDPRCYNINSPSLDAPCHIYAPLFYDSDTSIFHHSLASTPHIYPYSDLHNYLVTSLTQHSSSTTS